MISRLTLTLLIMSLLFVTGCNSLSFNENDLSNAKTISSKDKKVSIKVPEKWTDKVNISEDAILSAGDTLKSKSVYIIAESKAYFTDSFTLDEYYNLVVENNKKKLQNIKVKELPKLTINNKSANQYYFTGTSNDIKQAYLQTILEDDEAFYQILCLTKESNYEKHKKIFEDITKTFQVSDKVKLQDYLLEREKSTNAKPKTFTDESKKFKLTASNNYSINNDLNMNSVLTLVDLKNHKYVMILPEEKKLFKKEFTIEDYSNAIIKNFQAQFDSKITNVDIPVKNFTTKSFTINAVSENIKITYLTTIVETDTHFNQIITWTPQAKFEIVKEELTNIIKSFEQSK